MLEIGPTGYMTGCWPNARAGTEFLDTVPRSASCGLAAASQSGPYPAARRDAMHRLPGEGRRMPGTTIPIMFPRTLRTCQASCVVLFLPDLLAEVRASYPEVEDSGGRWVDAESLDA